MNTINKASILGCGSWGTALAMLLAEKSEQVVLWGRDSKIIHDINHKHYNPTYLPGAEVAANVIATAELGDLSDADIVVFVVPSTAVDGVAAHVSQEVQLRPDTPIVSCIKGIEKDTGRRPSEIIHAAFPDHPIAVLSGPTHAEEVATHMASAAVIGCNDKEVAEWLQDIFTLPWFRTYTSDDVAGIEYGGAAKNVFAIAAGMAEGLGLGDNAKAALVSRGLAELTRLGIAQGGRPETFQGLSGVGDLIVTCYSGHSRNNRFGQMLGKGHTLEEIHADAHMVAEGVPNTASLYECARRLDVRTPIIDQVYAILYEGKPPADALSELLGRDPRSEKD